MKQTTRTIQRPKRDTFTRGGSQETCYVCGGLIRGVPVDIGHGLLQVSAVFRHKRCEPGGARWMEIQAAKPKKERSELYDYYLEVENEGK